jgi:hypothetical protein
MDSLTEYDRAIRDNKDVWVPACGGNEKPMVIGERRFLYCFNPKQMRHAYLDMDTDVIVDYDPTVRVGARPTATIERRT